MLKCYCCNVRTHILPILFCTFSIEKQTIRRWSVYSVTWFRVRSRYVKYKIRTSHSLPIDVAWSLKWVWRESRGKLKSHLNKLSHTPHTVVVKTIRCLLPKNGHADNFSNFTNLPVHPGWSLMSLYWEKTSW